MISIFGQVDTLWTGGIGVGHSAGSVSSTGVPFKVNSAEIQLRKSAQTFVGTFNQKSIHGMKGYQLGMAYYRKWKWGYAHLGASYSNSLIYPSLSLTSTVYVNIQKGYEINLGLNTIRYALGNNLNVLNLGTTFYYGSVMASYQFRKPISGFANHRLAIRRYLNTPKEYIEISLARGLDIEGILPNQNEPFSISAIQFSFLKQIFDKTSIRISFGVTTAANNTENRHLINYGLGLKRKI